MEQWTQTSRRSWGSDHNSRASSGANRGNEKSRNSIVYNHLIEHPSDHTFLWQPTHSQGWRSRGGGGSFFHGSKKAASRQDVDSAARNSALGSSNGLHGRVGPKSAGAMLGSKSTAGPVLVSRHGRKGQAIPRDATPSRARTEPRLALAADGFSVSVTQLDGGFKNRLKPRSKTTPAMTSSSAGAGRHCDACAVDYVKHWLQNNVPTDSSRLLEEEDAASHISNMSSASISQQRASASAKKPEASSPQGPHPFYEPLQLLRKEGGKEANQVYLLMQQGRRALPDPSLNREPASLHTVCLPRRGQVKLTGLAYELDNPEFYDTRKDKPAPPKRWDIAKRPGHCVAGVKDAPAKCRTDGTAEI